MITNAADSAHYHEHLDALRKGGRTGVMRIMRAGLPDDCPRYIRMDALNEEWAQRNHGQSLNRLNERGGLSPCEAVAIIERRRYRRIDDAVAIGALKEFVWSPSASTVGADA